MYGTKSEILLEKILKNVGVFNTSPYFYAIESNPYSTKTERLLYLIEVHTRVLARLIPPGGNQGDLLAKASNADFDLEWIENYTSSVKHTVKLGEPINKGQAVYVSSADGTNMIVSKADNSTEATSSKTMGLLAFTGDTNAQGFVVTEGLLAGLDTSSANASDPVWLGTNGNLIFGLINKPIAPAHLVFIGIVTRTQQNNGEIFVKVQNGFELKEIHDVLLTSPTNGNMLVYDEVNSLWKNSNIIQRTSTDAALRITQTGTGEALRIEDSTNPDSTPVVVTADGWVGVGISNPDSILHVHNASAGTVTPISGSVMTLENNTTCYFTTLAPDANISGFVMGSPSDNFGAFIRWGHTLGKLEIATANSNDYIEFYVQNAVSKAFITTNGLGVNAQPVASAALQVDSTTQGVLVPRMTNAQRLAIVNPAVGLMVYCTNAVEGLYIYKSTGWTFVI